MNLKYTITCLLMLVVAHLQAQNLITGKILDNKGEPLLGASIYLENNQNRTVSGVTADISGNYKLPVPKHDDLSVVCSFVGYKTQKVRYTGQTTLNFTLEDDMLSLGSVDIIGQKIETNTLGISFMEQVTSTQKFNVKELETQPLTSIEAGLQGRLAGVDIVGGGGDPGSRNSIRIRGTASLNANSEPLIVVDGIPFPTNIDDGFNFATANDEDLGALVNISPNDIESVEVLRDAAATAIWGSQGANGVLVFTTKKGTPGKTKFSFSSKIDAKREPRTIPLLDGSQYVSMVQDAIWNSINDVGYMNGLNYSNFLTNSHEINFNPEWVYFNEYNQNTNWMDEVTQLGYFSDNSFSMSGGGDKAIYRVSMGYLNDVGTTTGNSFNRFNSLVSVNYKFSDRLMINSDLSYSISQRNSNWTMDKLPSARAIAMRKMPNMSPYVMDDDITRTTEYFTPLENFQGSFNTNRMYNPVAMVNESVNETTAENVRAIFRLQYNFFKGLDYTATVGFDVRSNKNKKFLPQSVTGVLWTDPYFNRSSDLMSDQLYLNTENKLIYNKYFNQDHKIILTGILQTNEGNSFSYVSETSGNASAALGDPVSGAAVSKMESGNVMTRRIGFIKNALYSYKEKYILSGGYRFEANSSLGRNSRWAGFPTIGAAWHFAEEGALRDVSWLEVGKLRLSWGQAGNPPGGAFPYIGVFQPIVPGYMGLNAISPASIQLDNLRWETITQSNLGIDLWFMEGRLSITADIYNKLTTDLLQKDVSLPSSTGFEKVRYFNSGKVSNKGVELLVNYDVIRKKDLALSVNFNMARNINNVMELPDNLQFERYEFGNGNYAHRIVEGNPIGSFYGYKYLGVYQTVEETFATDQSGNQITNLNGEPVVTTIGNRTVRPGDAKYMDVNGDGVIDQYDIVYLGNAMPLLTGGAGFTLKYKNYFLTAFFHGRYGQKIVNRTRIDTENMRGTDNQSTAVLQRWRHEGDDTDIPRALYNEGFNHLGSDRFIEDGSFLRLKTVSLRYSMPRKLLQNYKIDRFDIFATVFDLMTWTNYSGQDPEVSLSGNVYMLSEDKATTPMPRRYALGITMNF